MIPAARVMEPQVAVTAEEIVFLVKAARPGFWLTSIWFYLVPVGGRQVLDQAEFWLGLVYVSFPFGLLICQPFAFKGRLPARLRARELAEPRVTGALVYVPFRCHVCDALPSVRRNHGLGTRSTRRPPDTRRCPRPAKWLLVAFLAAEAGLIWTSTRDPWLAAFLAASATWFTVDVVLLWGDRPYSAAEMRFLFLAWNAVALASMPWMWHAASLAAR